MPSPLRPPRTGRLRIMAPPTARNLEPQTLYHPQHVTPASMAAARCRQWASSHSHFAGAGAGVHELDV